MFGIEYPNEIKEVNDQLELLESKYEYFTEFIEDEVDPIIKKKNYGINDLFKHVITKQQFIQIFYHDRQRDLYHIITVLDAEIKDLDLVDIDPPIFGTIDQMQQFY